nr:hypothetical protein [Blastocatellia bacterium]
MRLAPVLLIILLVQITSSGSDRKLEAIFERVQEHVSKREYSSAVSELKAFRDLDEKLFRLNNLDYL